MCSGSDISCFPNGRKVGAKLDLPVKPHVNGSLIASSQNDGHFLLEDGLNANFVSLTTSASTGHPEQTPLVFLLLI